MDIRAQASIRAEVVATVLVLPAPNGLSDRESPA